MENQLKNLTEKEKNIAFDILFKIKQNMVWHVEDKKYHLNENLVINISDDTYNNLMPILLKLRKG